MPTVASENVLLGNQAAVYYGVVGTPRVTWAANASSGVYVGPAPTGLAANLLGIIRDADIGGGGKNADVSSRLSPWELGRLATFKAEVTLKVPWAPDDLGLQAMLQAYWQRMPIPLAILDNLLATGNVSQGLWADFAVVDFSKTEPWAAEQMATFKVMPTASAVPPQWVLTAAYPDGGAV